MRTGRGLFARRVGRSSWGLKFLIQSSLISTKSAPCPFAWYIPLINSSTEGAINGAQTMVVFFNNPTLPIFSNPKSKNQKQKNGGKSIKPLNRKKKRMDLFGLWSKWHCGLGLLSLILLYLYPSWYNKNCDSTNWK